MRALGLLLISIACAPNPVAPDGVEAERPESDTLAMGASPAGGATAQSPADAAPAKVEGHLETPICLGAPVQKDPPPTRTRTACCYPAKEMLQRPIRAAFPAFRACYEARKRKDAEGRVVFSFRIEQDGTIQRICTGEATTMDDEGALRCMLEEMRKVQFASMGDSERAFCGLISLHYPVLFSDERAP